MKIGYLRVSTWDQDPALQEDALRGAGCEHMYFDRASGSSTARPQLAAALHFARAGDVLVVWKLDRLARSVAQLVKIIADLRERDIGFMSLTEALDTTTPSGMMLIHTMAAVGEFEKALVSERTRAALAAARQRGRVGGRPRSMSEQDVVAAKAMLRSNEMTAAEVARQIGVSVSTLYRWIPAARSLA